MNIDPLSSVPPPPPAEVAATETDLAPGFRFHPTDEELVSYYLKRRVLSKPFAVDAIAEVDLYKADPWDLPAQSRIKSRDMEWYFFSPLDKKYSNRSRTNRATGKGYWKTTGKDRPVKRGYRLIGMKKTLVFHVGKAPKGIRTNWVMHEYRLEDEELVRAGVPQDEYVVCRIFEKHGPGPQNGAQYGAPLADQDWEYDADNRPEDRQTPNLDIAQKENIQSGALILVSEDDHSTADASVTATEFNEKLPQDQSAAIDVDENSTPGVNYDVASANLGECGSFPEPQQDCCSPKDDFLEMKDLADPIDLESPGFQDDNLYFNGIRNDLVASNPFSDNDTLTEFDGVDEVFHAGVGSVESAESVSDLSIKDSYYHENVDLTNPVASKYLCSEQVADDMLCYDAANYTSTVEYDAFVEANDFLEPLDLEQSSIDPMDEMIAYLDATEGSLGNLDYGNFSGIGESHITSKVHANVQAPPTDTSDGNVPEGSPSRKALPHCQKEAKDDGYNFGLDKTFKGRLIGMLDSISSPPAFAAEPKDLKLTATSHPSSSSIHITAGMICINGLAINGNKKLWSDQKNDVSFLLSYSSMSASIHGDSGNLPNGKMQGGVISLAVRSGICLSFLSILFLATIFKVGSYVYSR